MKKVHKSEYYHHQADFFALCALQAKSNGEVSRAVTFYEYALNYELDAINTSCDETTMSPPFMELCRNAVLYALECGRRNKAKHQIETALARNPHPDVAAVFEDLLTRT